MRTEDRKRSTQRSYGNDERPSRVSGGRTRDAGASEQCSGVTCGKGQRDEVGRSGVYPGSSASEAPDDAEVVTPGQFGTSRERTRARAPDAEATPADDMDIVPEGERSER